MWTVEIKLKMSENSNISNWARDNSIFNLGKNMAIFCLYPKNLIEFKLKSNGLNYLMEEISRQSNIDSVTVLLAITLM